MEDEIYDVSITQRAKEIDMSESFVRLAVKLEKFKAKKVSGIWLLARSGGAQFKEKPFTITRREAL